MADAEEKKHEEPAAVAAEEEPKARRSPFAMASPVPGQRRRPSSGRGARGGIAFRAGGCKARESQAPT